MAEIDLVAAFEGQSRRLSATIDRISSIDDLPMAVATYLGKEGLPSRAVCWPAYAGLTWTDSGLSVEAR